MTRAAGGAGTDVSAAFVLPEDVLIFPAADLAPDVRAQAAAGPEDCIVTRPNTRQGSTVIDANGAALLERFRQPCTIVDAVLAFSRERDLDPQTVLGEAFALLQEMAAAEFLLTSTSLQAQPIRPTLQMGDAVAGWTVEQTVHLVLDTEVYRVRDDAGRPAALKIARPGHEDLLRPLLRHEALVLPCLADTAAPRLLQEGEQESRPFLVLEWCEGVPALAQARRLQRDGGEAAAPRLLKLCVAVLRAYAALHARGVVQGDVHPNNVIATEDDVVRVLDFGRARILGDSGPLGSPRRGGVALYFDPQWARAMLAGEAPAPPDPLSEQYCLGVLLREMFAGRPYLDFSLERERMLHQIVEDPPVPFIRHGAIPWPDVEQAIGRALAKDPAERFDSVATFADALERVALPGVAAVGAPAAPALLPDLLARVGPDGASYRALRNSTPLCSVNTGAAGIAYALYRIASLREDPAILALAEQWIDGAQRHANDDTAFYDRDLKLTQETLDRGSLFHMPAGLSCVEALIAVAQGHRTRTARAVEQFIARSRAGATDRLDLTMGKAGSLLGCAALLAALPADAAASHIALAAFGNELDQQLRTALAALSPVPIVGGLNLGIAHGWGGVLFALLRWREATKRGGTDAAMEGHLLDLGGRAEAAGDGLRWPWWMEQSAGTHFMGGWCNGSAGFVHLYTLAERLLGGQAYGELARRAALHAYDESSVIGDLCCGAAGRSYAMLNLYRHSGDDVWLERAHDLGEQATRLVGQWSLRRDSLYKGEAGVAVLLADLEQPELSCMPLFDAEA